MALIEIKEDAFGISKPATTLLKGLGYGVSATAAFATSRWRNGIAIANYKDWRDTLAANGVELHSADLTLNQRSDIQVQFNRVREQGHKEQIAFEAVEAHRIALEHGERETGDPLDDEWLENFWNLAARISSAERQKLWGRVLSRESLAPGAISVRALKFLADLTRSEGEKLQSIASCAYFCPDAATGPEAGLIYNIYGHAFLTPTPEMSAVGDDLPDSVLPLRYDPIFVPSGFWLQPGGFAHVLAVPLVREAHLRIGNRWFVIRMRSGAFHAAAEAYNFSSLFHSMQISEMGREVLDVIQEAPSELYVAELAKGIARYGTADLVELGNG